MTRNYTTPEQKAQAEARRAAFRALAKRIADMSEAERKVLAAQSLATTCEGHVLSMGNQMLVALQSPGATLIGGFWQWKRVGRKVSKGQHGFMIWAPKTGGKGAADEAGSEPADAENRSREERMGFIPVTVFDISQTEEI